MTLRALRAESQVFLVTLYTSWEIDIDIFHMDKCMYIHKNTDS